MSYESYDLSTQDASPVHLFQFLLDGSYTRFTNHPNAVDALNETWQPANITLGDIETTEDINKNNLDLSLPRDNSFASQFLTDAQDSLCTVTVFRGYQNDPAAEWIAYWKGRVANNRLRRNEITLNCESIFTSMKRPGIRGKMSKLCRHVHYGRGCNLDPHDSASDALYVEDIVSDVSADGLTLTIDAAALQSNGFYRAGMVMAPDGVFRFIRAHTGNQITISQPHVGFVSSDYVRLYRGCDRTTTACLAQNNLDNHGGFPYTPTVNPLGGTRLQ